MKDGTLLQNFLSCLVIHTAVAGFSRCQLQVEVVKVQPVMADVKFLEDNLLLTVGGVEVILFRSGLLACLSSFHQGFKRVCAVFFLASCSALSLPGILQWVGSPWFLSFASSS